MDETYSRRGHTYVSFFYDMKEKKLLLGTGGKDKTTVKGIRDEIVTHGRDATTSAQT